MVVPIQDPVPIQDSALASHEHVGDYREELKSSCSQYMRRLTLL